MPKIESFTNSVKIDNIEYPKNHISVSEEGSEVILKSSRSEIARGVYSDYLNSNSVPYATKAALITALRAALYA
jgi:hypothetical protein